MTKKALVRFDPKYSKRASSDFLAPLRMTSGDIKLASLKSGKMSKYGVVVYAGVDVSPEEIMKRIVMYRKWGPIGRHTSADLKHYAEQLPAFKIGNILELVKSAEVPGGFSLIIAELKQPALTKPRLP